MQHSANPKDAAEAFEKIESLSLDSSPELTDIFYTSQRKGHTFRVKLDAKGITLQRESSVGKKKQLVQLADIVGGRCMRRVIRTWPLGSGCGVCTTSSTCSVTSNNTSYNPKDVMSNVDDGDVSAYLYIFAYVLKKNLRHVLRRERTVLTLRFRSFDSYEENMREAEHWYRTLKWYKTQSLNELALMLGLERRRRLLVMLNPKSGSGKARELFHQHVAPVLNEAELPFDLYVTKYANYARDFVRLRNLELWSGIVAIGGDGLFYELLNGLLQRANWQDILHRIPLGIVPCGSGNGLARSIAHMYNEPYEPKPVLGAALSLVSGKATSLDVVRIELKNQVMYSFLSVGWGFISDIDIESERLRSLGYQRFTIWTIHRLINLRTYRGKISYLPKDDNSFELYLHESQQPGLKQSQSCNAFVPNANLKHFQSSDYISDYDFDDVLSLETSVNQSFRSRCDSWLSTGSRRSTYYSIPETLYHSVNGDSECLQFETEEDNLQGVKPNVGPFATLPPLHEPVPDNWIVEQGQYIMVHAAYQSHLGIDCFFAPSAKLNDGTIFLVIVRSGISRAQLFNFMYNLSTGTHLPTKQNEFIKVVPVNAFRIEPYDDNGIITIDGERVDYGAIQAEMLPGIAKVMVPK